MRPASPVTFELPCADAELDEWPCSELEAWPVPEPTGDDPSVLPTGDASPAPASFETT